MKSLLNETEVIGVVGKFDSATPWRELIPLYRRQTDGAYFQHIRTDEQYVHGSRIDAAGLEAGIAAGALSIFTPFPALPGHVLISGSFEFAQPHYIPELDALAARLEELRRRVTLALKHGIPPADVEVQDLWDAAFLVAPRNLVVAVLRAGVAKLSNDADWTRECIEDLARVTDYSSDLLSCRAHVLWGELSKSFRIDPLLSAAKNAYDEFTAPFPYLEGPVSRRILHIARAFAAFQHIHPGTAARIPHNTIRDARSGNPSALRRVCVMLTDNEDWASTLGSSGVIAPALVHRIDFSTIYLETFDRYTRTLYTLELSCDRVDRRVAWRGLRASTTGLSSANDSVPWRAGKRFAEELRALLSTDFQSAQSLPQTLRDKAGIHVAGVANDIDQAVESASSMDKSVPPCVFVRSDFKHEVAAKQRFTMMHELGHLIFDRTTSTHWACRDQEHANSDSERRANAFAAYFLAPLEEVRTMLNNIPEVGSNDFYNAATAVAQEYGLSMVTAAEHMVNCFDDRRRDPLVPEVRDRLRRIGEQQTASTNEYIIQPMFDGHYRACVDFLTSTKQLDHDTASRLLGAQLDSVDDP